MKAVILARVSTKEQEEGHSISAQKQRLVDYCKRKNLEVIKLFEVIESSTKGRRKEFHAMLDFAKNHPETIAIVADAVDRVQRSFKESVLLDDLIRRDKIEIHFFREGMILGKNASSVDVMRWDFSVMGAKSYVLQLSENVKRSVDFKLRNGEYTSQAPIGYMNIRELNGKSNIILDDKRADIIRQMFELYATGTYSIQGIVDFLRKKDLRNKSGRQGYLVKSHIHKILQNPFYYGVMVVKGRIYEHKYERLISKYLFDQCEAVRLGWHKKSIKSCKTVSALRGLVRCAISGKTATPDTKTKLCTKDNSIIEYHYLTVSNPAKPASKFYVNENVVLDQIKEVFLQLKMPDDIYIDVKDKLRGSTESEKIYHEAALKALRSEEDSIQRRLGKLMDLMLDEQITPEEHNIKKDQMKSRQFEVNEQMRTHQDADNTFRQTVTTLLKLTQNAYEVFESSNSEEKRQFINLMFSNLKLNGAKLEYALVSPFNAWMISSNSQLWCRIVDDLRTKYYHEVMALAIVIRPFERLRAA